MFIMKNYHKGLIVIPTEGFCNRLRMICSSYILSQHLNIPLHIKWETGVSCPTNFFDYFNIEIINSGFFF